MAYESPVTRKKNRLSIISDMRPASPLLVKQSKKSFLENGKFLFSISSASL